MSEPNCIQDSNPCGFLNISTGGGSAKKVGFAGKIVTIRADSVSKNFTILINDDVVETARLPTEPGYFGFCGWNGSRMTLVSSVYTTASSVVPTRIKDSAGKLPLHYAVTLPLGWETLVTKLLEFDSVCAKSKDSKHRLPIECAIFENESPSLDTICAVVKRSPGESFKFMFNKLSLCRGDRAVSRDTDHFDFPDTLTVGDVVIRGPHWQWQDQVKQFFFSN